MTDLTGSSGRGRLAEVLATRGGRAAPEAPFVIEHREALIYMLCEAAELEHGIMCQYLFAAFSLKQREDEGLTPEELDVVDSLAPHDRSRCDRGDAAPRARSERTLGDRSGAASDPAESARARASLPRRCEPDARAVRRAGPAALHVPRASGGDGAGRCDRHRRAPARGGAPDGRRRHRAAAAGLRNRRPLVSLDRGRSGAPRRQVRRAQPVRRAATRAGDERRFPLARAGGRHRPRVGPASARHDPRAGRRGARALGGGALRRVRPDPRRVPPEARGESCVRSRPAGDLRDRAQ